MAFTGSPVDSVQRAAQLSAKKNEKYDNGPMHYARFEYTHAAGAGTGEIDLVMLPAGNIKVWPSLCRIDATQMVLNATMDIGHRAYTQPDGTVVAEDDAEFLNDAAVGAGVVGSAFLLPTAPTVYSTNSGLEVFASIDTANIEDGDTITGWVAYTKN